MADENETQTIGKEERIGTYVVGLDELMEGGIPRGYVTLVCGHAGTMKSSFTYSILYNGHKEKKLRGIYLTLEQSKQSIVEHMTKLGMDPKGMDNLVVVDLGRVRKEIAYDKTKPQNVDWLKSILGVLKNYKEKFGCEVLVLDSLAALYALTTFKNPRSELFYFFEQIRDLGVTTLLISEMPTDRQVFGLYGIEDFLSDGIIHLKVEQTDRGSNLYVGVVKMRKTNHTRSYMPLIFESGRFEIVRH
ncbi:MAG: AAA family ATPase [Euryarchaeota archaeon]|nr:AAA family ATPase [Euryarchaeota archaeon]